MSYTQTGKSKEKKGGYTQKYRETHEKSFLPLWKEGRDPLEIKLILGLSDAQIAKHTLQAYKDCAERNEPSYRCFPFEKLPEQIRKCFPNVKQGLVRISGDGSCVKITMSTIPNADDDSSIEEELLIADSEQNL